MGTVGYSGSSDDIVIENDEIRLLGSEPLAPEEILILTSGNSLYLAGGDRSDREGEVQGTGNAVSTFLEDYLGVRWLFPTTLGEIAPRQGTITLPDINRREQPIFHIRVIRNVPFPGHGGGAKAEIPGGLGIDRESWRKVRADEVTGPWFRRQRLGARSQIVYNHSYTNWWEKYGRRHPEFFALKENGRRGPTGNVGVKLCVSNRALWDFVARDRISQLKANPRLLGVSISPNDGQLFCMCENCRAMDASDGPSIPVSVVNLQTGRPAVIDYVSLTDRYFTYFNEVAKRVGAGMPDRYVGVHAYSCYRELPVHIARLEPNLSVSYVGLVPEQILCWGKLTTFLMIRPNLLWDGEFFGLPRNYSAMLRDRIVLAAEHNGRGFDFDGCHGNWGSQGLSYYILAKLLWNPHADIEMLTRDYCRAAYGPGADAMVAFNRKLMELEARISRDDAYRAWKERDRHNPQIIPRYYTPELIAALQHDIDAARNAIGRSDAGALERLEMQAVSVQYARHVMAVLNAADAADERDGKARLDNEMAALREFVRRDPYSWALSHGRNIWHLDRSVKRMLENRRLKASGSGPSNVNAFDDP